MVKRTTEDREHITEQDVAVKLKTLSPMLQQEYLENVLNRMTTDPNLNIFSSRRLAELHAVKGMYSTAARIMTNAALVAVNFDKAKEIHLEAAALSIKAGDYLLAEDNFRNAVTAAAPSEKAKVQLEQAKYYMIEAEALDRNGKMSKAAQIYERILKQAKDTEVKRKVMERLMVLYEKLGRISDSIRFRESIKNL